MVYPCRWFFPRDEKEMAPTDGFQALLQPVTSIARIAGEKILEVYNGDFDVEIKDDDSPLTAADLASHHTIVDGLSELTPDWPILSEESRAIDFATRSGWSRYWLVDPLDGTREFVKRNGEFTVNIALIDEHKPVLGVVHVPVTGRDYFACDGAGAWRQDPNEDAEAIAVTEVCPRPVRVVGSKSHRGTSLDKFLSGLGEHEMIPMGSSLKICLVADGSADIYPRIGLTSEWDTAAAQAVLECAGGRMTDTDGAVLRYNTKDELLNPFFLAYGDQNVDWKALL